MGLPLAVGQDDRIAAIRTAIMEAGAQSIRLVLSEDRSVSFEMFGKGSRLVILRRHPLGLDIFRLVDGSNDLSEHLNAAIAYLMAGSPQTAQREAREQG